MDAPTKKHFPKPEWVVAKKQGQVLSHTDDLTVTSLLVIILWLN